MMCSKCRGCQLCAFGPSVRTSFPLLLKMGIVLQVLASRCAASQHKAARLVIYSQLDLIARVQRDHTERRIVRVQ